MSFYIKVNELPSSIQKALTAAGYGRPDISVEVEETFEPRPPSADGRRGFCAACRLDGSDEFRLVWGSWGGSNMFVKSVDDVEGTAPIPPHTAFVRGLGSGGSGYPAYATLHVGPNSMNPKLLPIKVEVTEREAKILCIFKKLKSGVRKEYLARMKAAPAEVDSLVARGFLTRNAAGATSITTEGRNAAGHDYY